MIGPADLARLLDELYAAHWILWNVGFTPDELFVGASMVLNAEPPAMHAYLKVQRADGEFVLPVGPALDRKSSKHVLRAWLRFIDQARIEREKNAAALERRLRRTIVWDRRVEFLTRLAAKGFHLTPGAMN